jgi:predicted nucleic acid-binding protein
MPPRFVDASVFVHAYLRPKRELKSHERQLKSHARGIMTRINEGEEVLTSVVHVSEVANLLEAWMPLEDARAVLQGLCTRETIKVLPAERRDLIEALAVGSETRVGMSDALAVVLMRTAEVSDVYSFDKDFDRFDGIQRVSQ